MPIGLKKNNKKKRLKAKLDVEFIEEGNRKFHCTGNTPLLRWHRLIYLTCSFLRRRN